MAAGKYTHRIPVDISDLDIPNEPHSYNREHTLCLKESSPHLHDLKSFKI